MEQHKRAHKWAFPLGLALVLLAAVGLVSLARLAAGGIKQQLDHPRDRLRYEKFLANIIRHDPDPFDSPDTAADVSQLLDICLWSLTQDAADTPDKYPMEDDGPNTIPQISIPQEDVAAKYRALFGSDPPSFATVEGTDFDFTYDPEKKIYRVPVTGTLEIYSPRVIDVNKTGRSIELTVGYIPYADVQYDENTGQPIPAEPAKYMIIVLFEQDDGSFQLGSIREPAAGEVASDETVVS